MTSAAATGAPAPHGGRGGGGDANAALATMLRDCAYHVERNQFHPVLYQALAKLHAYAGEHAGSTAVAPAPPPVGHGQGRGGSVAATAAAGNGPDQNGDHRRADSRGSSGDPGLFDAAASASFESASGNKDDDKWAEGRGKAAAPAGGAGTAAGVAAATPSKSREQDEDYLKDIKKEFKAISKQFKKLHLGGFGSASNDKAETNENASASDQLLETAQRENERRANAEWCEEHFVMGCACKNRQNLHGKENNRAEAGTGAGPATAASASATAAASAELEARRNKAQAGESSDSQQRTAHASPASTPAKPCFQRPINPGSNLIANGWIEQQRRSKMRIVWKDILASLVEGRRPGEETTLWIQRQITNAQTGKAELEALHQIPMKWLEDVTYLDFYGDHRFSLKIYNVADEFQFRTTDEASARNWVSTLDKARDASLGRKERTGKSNDAGAGGPTAKDMGNLDDWGREQQSQQQQQDAASVGSADSAKHATPQTDSAASTDSDAKPDRMSIKELRAIAHGAGINTYGMERADLERIARRLGQTGREEHVQAQAEPAAAAAASARAEAERKRQEHAAEMRRTQEDAARAAAVEKSRQHAAAERQRLQEESARKAAVEKSRQEAAAARAAAEEEKRRKEWQRQHQEAAAAAKAAEEKRRQEEEALRIRQQEWQRQQEAMAAEKKRQEEAAAAAARAEQQRQWQQQQEAMAAEKKRQEEAAAAAARAEQQRQWQQQQWQQQQWQQQQQQQQHYHGQGAPPPPPPHPQQQNTQQNGGASGGVQSPVNMKYAKQVTGDKSEEAEQASISRIKREILINWALTPPMYQMLRPIHQLVVTIHNSFPPAHGVPAHAYFAKWKPITADSVTLGSAMGNAPDEEKLKKAVRKIRFFLHPDKLPRDLDGEQSFMCRMLWDITSDSWEEFCKQKEELDWIR